MSADTVKLSGAAFCLAQPIGGIFVRRKAVKRFALSPQCPSAVVRRRSDVVRPSQSEAIVYLDNGLT